MTDDLIPNGDFVTVSREWKGNVCQAVGKTGIRGLGHLGKLNPYLFKEFLLSTAKRPKDCRDKNPTLSVETDNIRNNLKVII